jgi:FkbM family methyltransferase
VSPFAHRARRESVDPEVAAPAVPSLGNGVSVPITPDQYPLLLETLRTTTLPGADDEFLIDWMGVRTRIAMLPWAPRELAGTVNFDLPIPDDGYRSEDSEYAALAAALVSARHTFRIVEVGAGWAPWAVAGVVVARRTGLAAKAIAVEADPVKAGWAEQHARDNAVTVERIEGSPQEIAAALAIPQSTDLRLVVAAVWHDATILQFPLVSDDDMGAAVWTLPGTDVDYRGAHVTHRDVPSVSMRDLLRDDQLTDLLHVDVQGLEYELLRATAGEVQDHTRLMNVGTHSRWNEGMLQEFFLSRGWGLRIDQPCTAHFTMTHPTLQGFTVQDGNQLYENPFLM